MEEYPIRINKYLALKKYSTRRGADELIERKKVFINGKLAQLGDKVQERDVVEVRLGKTGPVQYRYYVYNKPKGVITHSPQMGERDARTASGLRDVFPVGRLDKNSRGLLILTNDGRVTDRLLNPDSAHEKEYLVRTREKIRKNFKQKMEGGVDIGDHITKPCKVQILNDHAFRITLTEGKKHQIRRMVVALFNDVTDLQRTRVMNLTLSGAPEGGYREVRGEELKEFLKGVGL